MGAGGRSLVGTQAGGLGVGLAHAPIPVSLWVRDRDNFRIVDVNEVACAWSGLAREEMIGRTIEEAGGNKARGFRDLLRAAGSDAPVTREIPHVMPNGEVRQLEIVYVGVESGGVVAFTLDVTEQRNTEQRLRITEDRYRTLVGAANEGVWLVDPAGRTTFANNKVGEILRKPLTEIAAGNMLDFVGERDRPAVARALACPGDTPDAFEARFRRSDGSELLCLLSVSPMPGDGPRPATLCVLADMSAVQRERELRIETEQRFRRMVEAANEGVWTSDRDGRTTFANDALAGMLGVEREALIGRRFTELIVDDERTAAIRARIRRDGEPTRGEFRLRRADGTTVDAIANLSLLRDDDGELLGALAMITDVSQLKREQADLRESRERFAQVFEEAPAGMAFIGAGHLVRGRFLGANRAFHELLGYTEDELLEQSLESVTHHDDVEAERALAAALFESRRSAYELDKRFVRADGAVVWARFRAQVLRDDRGAPLYGLGVAVDISAERSAARAAAEARARVAALLDSTPDAVVEIAADGAIAQLNGAALRMFGVEREEALGKPAARTLVPARLSGWLGDTLDDWLAAARAGGPIEPTETTLMRADASEFPAAVRVTPVNADDGVRLLLYVRNLGPQARAVAAQREAEERFERLFRDGPSPAVAIDMQGRLTDVNPAFCRLAGRGAPELIGRDASEVLSDADDAQEPPWRAGADRPGPLTAARRITRPDGGAAPVHIIASLVRDAASAPLHWLCQCVPQGLAEGGSLPPGEALSYRERQVLGLLAHGLDGPAIAERLGLSRETVRSYATSARDKTGAKTRTEAVALALARGEISL